MAKSVSLKSLFESNKGELEQKLAGLKLPKDASKIQQLISDYLSRLFESDGEFRQNLTQSEDYILQSTLRILTAQENFTNGLIANNSQEPPQNIQNNGSKQSLYTTLIGTGVGAVAGGFIGAWAAVIGALAGNAVVAYVMTKKGESNQGDANQNSNDDAVDTNVFLNIISNVCESIDGVIDTYRIQVNRIVKDYENKEKPTLQSDYSMLLDQIVNVNKIATSANDVPDKLKQAIALMVECLENYGLRIENNQIINA